MVTMGMNKVDVLWIHRKIHAESTASGAARHHELSFKQKTTDKK